MGIPFAGENTPDTRMIMFMEWLGLTDCHVVYFLGGAPTDSCFMNAGFIALCCLTVGAMVAVLWFDRRSGR